MTTKAKAMTPREAKSFDRISTANIIILRALLKCPCSPYEDVFTYNRWKAQGFQVQRGERGHRLPLVKVVDKEDKETGEVIETRRILGNSIVFCRCQVKPIGKEN